MGEDRVGAKEVIAGLVGIGLTAYLWSNGMSAATIVHAWLKTDMGIYILLGILGIIWICFAALHGGVAASVITFILIVFFYGFIDFVQRSGTFGFLVDCVFTMILVYCGLSVLFSLPKIPGIVYAIVKPAPEEPPIVNSEDLANLPSLEAEKIVELGNDYSDQKYFVGQDIPSDRVANIYKRLGIPAEEDILIFLDTSWWQSGKVGLAVGRHGIYLRTWDGRGFLSWPELGRTSLSCDPDSVPNVLRLGSKYKFESELTYVIMSSDKIVELLSRLASVARTSLNQEI